jgi:hypothetical protein
MVTVVPADAAQAVIGPHEPATPMIIVGVVVAGIIRVVVAADKEMAMTMVEEATVMMEATACDVRSAAVPSASATMERMKAAAMKTSAVETTTAMKTSAVETTTAMKATTAVEATATTVKASAAAVEPAAAMSATMDFGHEPVGCVFGRRHDLRCHERHRSRGPVWRRNQNQHRRRKTEKAEPPICNRRHA